MNKLKLYLFSLLSFPSMAQGPYAPPADQEGSDALHMDSELFVSWATAIEIQRGYLNAEDTTFVIEGSNKASFGMKEDALGSASGISTSVVSLGDGGVATVSFNSPIVNGEGPDFAIFENGVTSNFLELAHVEVSSNGVDFIRFPSHSLTSFDQQVGAFEAVDATNIYNLAGKYQLGYGTPFDLEELSSEMGVDIMNITHVRIIDAVGSIGYSGTEDSFGNPINDPFPTPFESCGFDLDAVGVIHEKSASISTQEELSIRLFPNPSNGLIQLEGITEKSSVQLYDYTGKLMNSWQINCDAFLSLNYPNGIYFLSIHTDSGKLEKFKLFLK